ncbi:MAG: tetratricopeptide repeat protein [Thermodesulfobacteriota bacterium]
MGMGKKTPKKNKLAKKLRNRRNKMVFKPESSIPLRLYNSGRMQEAETASAEELKSNPDNPTALYVYGLLSLRQGQLLRASEFFIHAIDVKPKFTEAYFELGNTYHLFGQREKSIECFKKALAINKNYLRAWNKLGIIFYELGRHEDIVTCFKRAIEINSLDPNLHSNLAYALINTGRLQEAENSCKKALDLNKDYAPAYRNLGAICEKMGAANDAVSFYRQSLALDPEHNTHSSILFDLNYVPTVSQEEIYLESLRWNELYAPTTLTDEQSLENDREEGRRLKIGYLSPDFCDHSVSYFIEPVLRYHNRENIKVYCYANVEKTDVVTQRLRDAADEWHDIWGMEDTKVIDLIKENEIDILVDLAGHSKGNRLLVFAQRPAKVQITWLGYPNTTGLKALDYRLTDAIADPPGEADKLHSEKLIRMKNGFLCYQPEATAPEVRPAPCIKKGYITFGSFNNMSKISTEVVRLWAEILNSVTNSRLLLKSSIFANLESKVRYIKMFEAYGIVANRIEILGRLPKKEAHLDLYRKIDIGLDPFPYNGTTTTFEALWMGVPVVTMLGDRHSGRVGASIMNHTGLKELVAESWVEYKNLTVSLAHNIDKLTELRGSIREKLQQSSLMDSQQFTKTLEGIYKEIYLNGFSSKK